MTASTTTIKVSPSQSNLLAGPLAMGLVIGAAGAFGIGCLFWKPEDLIDHWEVLLFFGLIFVPVFVIVRLINASISFWKIENGAVYKGKRLLFQLSEIQEAEIGLPDNWIAVLSRLPIKFSGKGGFALHAASRKELIILRLTQGRWFMWSGTMYPNFEQFRAALYEAAPSKTITDVPDSIVSRLGLLHANRIMHE